jgi:hypothetical protein
MGIDAMGIEVKFNVGKSLATHAVYQMSASEGKALGEDTAFQSFASRFDQYGHRRHRCAIGRFFSSRCRFAPSTINTFRYN